MTATVVTQNTAAVLSAHDIAQWQPYPMPQGGVPPQAIAEARMRSAGQWQPWQMLGRRFAIGCVALEITQRCNLDCTYCYLSEFSEALKDIPIEEVFRRIDMIHDWYGAGTDVQVTGGDPTLRQRDELIAIVRRIKQRGLRASLFTNGIRATRELLAELASAGLEDVAFHVDMTQQRAGYANEAELNTLREEYIERARGLPLSVFFNTTVFAGNLHDVPALAQFFLRHHRVVRLASFQVGADIGRGVERTRAVPDAKAVMQALREGSGAALDFSAASAGHAACNGYAYALVVNGKAFNFFDDPAFVQEILERSANVRVDRANLQATVWRAAAFLFANPGLLLRVAHRAFKFGWQHAKDLVASRGRIGKLSFFVHNFMDAAQLDRERCEACAFMVMTPEGPISMCVHNAKRDDYLLQPAKVERQGVVRFFNPADGSFSTTPPDQIEVTLSRKNARGRAKVPREEDRRTYPLAAE